MQNYSPKDSARIKRMAQDKTLRSNAHDFFLKSCEYQYSYNFTWLGRPVIQYPQDIVALQEVIWTVKPKLIIETGIAHGGSLMLSASILELLGLDGQVLGIDVDIRPHNRLAIEQHPLSRRITMFEGSSISPEMAAKVKAFAKDRGPIMVVLDSNHTHEHVKKELEIYSPLVTCGSYLVVYDTVVEDMPKSFFPNRPWGPGDNPKTAVHEFLKISDRFEIDEEIQDKLVVTVAPDGYLKCIKG